MAILADPNLVLACTLVSRIVYLHWRKVSNVQFGSSVVLTLVTEGRMDLGQMVLILPNLFVCVSKRLFPFGKGRKDIEKEMGDC